MKVLHFYKTYFPDSYGGVEQVIFQLAHGTARRGIDVEVLALAPDVGQETRAFDNHTIHRIRRDFEVAATGISFGAFARFASLARQADVVHLHYPWPFADVVHFVTAVGKPVVLTYHSDIVRQKLLARLYKPLMGRFLRSVDRIVATSQNYLESSDVLQNYREKIEVIPIGLDRSTYPDHDVAHLEKWRDIVGRPFFLFVGMLRYYKGLHILLEALRGTDYSVVIAGAGPTERELRAHAAQIGLTTVHFLGELTDSEKVALFNLSQAVVFPSHLRSEAFGVSLLEGAMFGKPMISSEIGTGTSYVNIHNETGLVVPPNNPAALRNALRRLHDDPGLAGTMGVNARRRYETYFTADLMVDRYVDLYQEVISRRGGGST